MKSFEPYCLATAIQGMGYTDREQACRIILENTPEIPIAPNLTNLGFMKSRACYIEGMPCVRVDEEKDSIYFDTSRDFDGEMYRFYEKYLNQDLDAFAISPEYHPGFYAMLEALQKNRPAGLKIVKLAVNGPITFTIRLVDEKNKPIFYNEALRDAVIKTLAMKVRWQEKKIKETIPGVQTMIQIGEAGLGMYGSAFLNVTAEQVRDALHEIIETTDGFTFIHCCANTDWPLLMDSGASAISFDAYEYGDRVALYSDRIQSYIKEGGILAWGIVPTTNDKFRQETPEGLRQKLESFMELMVQRGVDRGLLRKQSLITPSCSTALMTLPLAEKVYQYTRALSGTVRRAWFGLAG